MAKRIPIEELVGRRYGRLTILGDAGPHKTSRRILCACDCGAQAVVWLSGIMRGTATSCGCYRLERLRESSITHGEGTSKRTPEYLSWSGMKGGCLNSNNNGYYLYGGRGIAVCVEWMEYRNFLRDMGRKPSRSHSLDRMDNNGNYCKENCRWATARDQSNNRRNTITIEFNGKVQSLMDWSLELGMSYSSLRKRICSGWTIARAIETPSKSLNGGRS